jgi:hypothetical protein
MILLSARNKKKELIYHEYHLNQFLADQRRAVLEKIHHGIKCKCKEI